MKNNKVIDLAIKRHDLDAHWFQNEYDPSNRNGNRVFTYGRKLVLDELEQILKHLPKGSRILDVGSGTGHLTQWLKEKDYEVKGLEPSEEMLSYANKNFPDIQFTKGLSSLLPYNENEFDLIVSFEVLRYLNKEVNEQTYKEFYRVLKPSGQFFVTHVNRYSSDFYFFYYYLKGLICRIRKITYHYCYFTSPKKEENIIKAIGFKSATSIGRMDGRLRIADKLGKFSFHICKVVSEFVYGKQRFFKNPFKSLAGHLIIIGKK